MNPIQQTSTQAASGSAQRAEALTPRAQAGRAGASSQPAGTAGASGTSAGDTVSISQSARQLLEPASSQGAASGSASVSSQRLGALRQAISAGTYTVDARQIAQGLLRDSQALAGTVSGRGAGSGA